MALLLWSGPGQGLMVLIRVYQVERCCCAVLLLLPCCRPAKTLTHSD